MNTIPQPSVFFSTRRRLALSVGSLAAAFVLTQSLPATPLYWDINGATANSGTAVTGAWDGVNTFWNTDSTGTGGTPQATTSSSDDLFFSSGTGMTGTGTVTFTGAVAANSITFEEGTVTLAGISTPSLTLGAGGITFSNGTGANVISAPVVLGANMAFTNNDNSTQTISGGLSGAFNLEINATSTGGITLSGASTGYSGTTTLTAGALTAQGAANNTFTILGTGGINLNGGTLNLRSNGAANGGANIITGNGTTGNNVTIGSAAVTINVNNNGSNSQNTFSFNNLSIGTGQLNVSGGNNYSLRFAGTTTLTGNATINTTTSQLSLVGVIGDGGAGYGLTKTGAAATYASSGQPGVLTVSGANTYTGVTSVLGGILVLNGDAPSGANGTLGNATSAVLLGDTSGSVNSYLMANNFTIGRDITVQSGNTGIAYLGSSSTSNTAGTTYSGNITLGTASGTGHGVTLVSGAFHFTAFSGIIQDPAGLSGAGGVVTLGATSTANFLTGTFSPNPTNSSSTILVSGNNTYTGGTIINTAAGVIRIGNANAFGTGNLSIVSGTIQMGLSTSVLTGITSQTWDGNFTFNNYAFQAAQAINMGTSPITLTGDRIVTISQGTGGGNTTTVGGIISGSGRNLQIRGNTTSSSGLILNGANTFDGGLTISGPSTGSSAITVTSGNASALGTGQVNLTNSANSKVSLSVDTAVGSLTSGLNNGLASFTGGTSALGAGTYDLTFTGGGGSGAAGTATVNSSGVVTAVSLTSVGADYTSAPTITLTGSTATVTPATFGSSSINLNPGTARTLTITGNNASPATYTGVISGSGGNLVKTGSGTQILTGINTYSGSTQVNGGVLNISDAGLINATSAMTVGGGDFSYNNTSSAFIKTIALNSGTVSGTGSLVGAITMAGGVLSNSGTMGTVTVNGGLVTSIGTAGAVTLNSGGGINPGDTGVAGTFSADSLTWNSNDSLSGLRFDLGVNTAASDTINLTSAFTKGTGSTFIFNFGDLGYTPSVTYTLLTFDSTDFSVGDFSATGVAGTFILNGNDLSYMTAAIPEPSTYAAILGALVLAGVVYRRRRV